MNNKRIIALLKVLLASIALVGVVSAFVKHSNEKEGVSLTDSYYLYDFAMGTSVSYQIFGKEETAKRAAEELNQSIKNLDENVISWRNEDSELAKANANHKVASEYELSDELARILERSLALCDDTDGALDITIRPLAKLWGIEDKTETEFVVPEEKDIESVLSSIGYDKVKLTGNGLIINNEDIILDLGAVGKGYGLDYIRDMLVNKGAFSEMTDISVSNQKANGSAEYDEVTGAIISVGGSILVIGSKSDGTTWKVGIRNPKGNIDEMLGYVELQPESNMCISTSGDYEKFIEKDGVRYHHILDTKTGYPADTELASVTVICEDGLVSDGLSTACFILGYENSKKILQKYNASAIFIDKENNIKTVGDISFVKQ